MQATASLQKMQEVQTKSEDSFKQFYFYLMKNRSSESINKCKIIWDLMLCNAFIYIS